MGHVRALYISIYSDIIMARSIEFILRRMRENPSDVRFEELSRVCERYFGAPRRSSGSHRIFKTPWIGDPRINVQNDRGRAKAYQVRQVLSAIDKLENGDEQER